MLIFLSLIRWKTLLRKGHIVASTALLMQDCASPLLVGVIDSPPWSPIVASMVVSSAMWCSTGVRTKMQTLQINNLIGCGGQQTIVFYLAWSLPLPFNLVLWLSSPIIANFFLWAGVYRCLVPSGSSSSWIVVDEAIFVIFSSTEKILERKATGVSSWE